MYSLGGDPSGSGALPGAGAASVSRATPCPLGVSPPTGRRRRCRRVGALGQPLDGGDAPGGADRMSPPALSGDTEPPPSKTANP